jgi:hypothetical protein
MKPTMKSTMELFNYPLLLYILQSDQPGIDTGFKSSRQDGIDVRALGQENLLFFTNVFDLDAKDPVELSYIGNFHLLSDLDLECVDQWLCSCHNHAIVNMNKNNDRPTFL